MKIYKSVKLVGLVAILGLLVACSSLQPAMAEEKSKGLMAVITPPHNNIFFKAENDAAVERAHELGYETLELVHDNDAAKQASQIETAVSSGADAILIDNAGADATIAPLKEAKKKGVPAFLFDREINTTGVAVSQIISNNYQGGKLGANYFVKLMEEDGKYLELYGRPTDTNAKIRSDAYHDVIDQYPGMEMVAQKTAHWSEQEAFEKTESVIQAHPDIDGIISGNDTMAMGAQAALNSHDMGDVIVVGLDGSPEVVDSIQAGEIDATVLQPCVRLAEMAAEQADKYLRTGKTGLPEKQLVDCELITPENADEFVNFEHVEK